MKKIYIYGLAFNLVFNALYLSLLWLFIYTGIQEENGVGWLGGIVLVPMLVGLNKEIYTEGIFVNEERNSIYFCLGLLEREKYERVLDEVNNIDVFREWYGYSFLVCYKSGGREELQFRDFERIILLGPMLYPRIKRKIKKLNEFLSQRM